jgi:hypothetical protein
VGTSGKAAPAGHAEFRIKGDMIAAPVIAKVNGTDRNAGVTIYAAIRIDLDDLGQFFHRYFSIKKSLLLLKNIS